MIRIPFASEGHVESSPNQIERVIGQLFGKSFMDRRKHVPLFYNNGHIREEVVVYPKVTTNDVEPTPQRKYLNTKNLVDLLLYPFGQSLNPDTGQVITDPNEILTSTNVNASVLFQTRDMAIGTLRLGQLRDLNGSVLDLDLINPNKRLISVSRPFYAQTDKIMVGLNAEYGNVSALERSFFNPIHRFEEGTLNSLKEIEVHTWIPQGLPLTISNALPFVEVFVCIHDEIGNVSYLLCAFSVSVGGSLIQDLTEVSMVEAIPGDVYDLIAHHDLDGTILRSLYPRSSGQLQFVRAIPSDRSETQTPVNYRLTKLKVSKGTNLENAIDPFRHSFIEGISASDIEQSGSISSFGDNFSILRENANQARPLQVQVVTRISQSFLNAFVTFSPVNEPDDDDESMNSEVSNNQISEMSSFIQVRLFLQSFTP